MRTTGTGSKNGFLLVLMIVWLVGLYTTLLWAAPGVPRIHKKKKGNIHSEQTFVGKIKLIDTRERTLVLTTTEGDQEETFDYKKGVRILSAHQSGDLKISDLKIGMLVTVFMKSTKSSTEIYEILIMQKFPHTDSMRDVRHIWASSIESGKDLSCISLYLYGGEGGRSVGVG